jgi:regulator of replication initiation timing
MTEIELLKKQLAEAMAENQALTLRLENVMLLLKSEMTASGKLPKPQPISN